MNKFPLEPSNMTEAEADALAKQLCHMSFLDFCRFYTAPSCRPSIYFMQRRPLIHATLHEQARLELANTRLMLKALSEMI